MDRKAADEDRPEPPRAVAWEAPPASGFSGLLWAYAFEAGRATPLSDREASARLEGGLGWVWLHLPLSDQRARRLLERLDDAPAAIREALLDPDERVHLQFADGWAYGCLPDMERDLDGRPQGLGRLHIAFDGGRMITARRHALRCVDAVRRSVLAGAELASPDAACIALVESFLDLTERETQRFAEALDAIEDRVLVAEGALDGVALGPLRRELARRRRELLSLRSALGRAITPRSPNPFILLAEQLPRLAHESEDLDRELLGQQERARLLHEEIDTRIAADANRSMRALTILSTLLIPPTLVVGAFGMNLPGIPFSTGSAGFAEAAGLCVAVVAAACVLLRRWRIL